MGTSTVFTMTDELRAVSDGLCLLEDLGDADIALGPHLEEKTCDRFRLKTIIRLS